MAARWLPQATGTERDVNGLSAAQRHAARQVRVAPLVAALEQWMRGERAKLSRHADVAKAMDYMLKRWDAFARFLDDGRICLTNNAAERALGKQTYGLPMDEDWGSEPRLAAAKVRLRDVLTPRKTTIGYLYDFGDSWEHELTVADIRQGDPANRYPRYVAGEWNAPPEDCGGIPEFYDKLDAAADPRHPEHDEIKEWLGDYDPKSIDEFQIKITLGRIAKRRAAARARLSKSAN